VINVSVFGGFAYADTPFTGMSIVVTTKGNRCLARRLAYELARVAWDQRQAAADCGVPVPEAVRRALTSQKGPVILADVGDNIGGGSPGDGTLLLRELLRAAARDAVVVIADAQAVAEATAAGLGMTFDLMVGGKSDKMHGEPLLIHGTVERLTDGRYRTEGQSHFAAFYGEEVNMGRCALMRCADVRILLTERKTPPGDLAQLRSQGIVPEDQHIIVVKSPVAFRDAYAPIAASIITVDTPGLCTADLRRLGFNKMVGARFPLEMHTEWSDNKPMSAHRG
jgi:microcystin degradation protein MlrC